jgi:hypothetical protein
MIQDRSLEGFIAGDERLKAIKNLEIYNTRENKIERI